MGGSGARPLTAALISVAVLIGVAVVMPAPAPVEGLAPNVILVVTDDQAADTLAGDPVAMPWLSAQLDDPGSGWTSYTNAVVTTPMCCPSRATILSGLPASATGVTDNATGWRLDETRTLAVWLHDAGYRTALIGKYLNGYPWDRGPYVPPGWDRWFAKTNDSIATTYEAYGVVDQTTPRRLGSGPEAYATDVLAAEARAFVERAPVDQPWFLYFAPPAPHAPFTPAPRHDRAFEGAVLPPLSATGAAGGPAWLRALPPLDEARLADLARERLDARATLLAVDDSIRALSETVEARGETDRTVIIVTSDNGRAFGEHGWVGKQVPYEPSIRVPLAVKVPGGAGGTTDELASNLDLAPTIVALGGARSNIALPGRDLVGEPPRAWVPISWDGGAVVPAWRGVRTADGVFIRWSTGEEELFDLASDPNELRNLAPAARGVRVLARYRAMLEAGYP